jgi:hypothetical protein
LGFLGVFLGELLAAVEQQERQQAAAAQEVSVDSHAANKSSGSKALGGKLSAICRRPARPSAAVRGGGSGGVV